MTVSDSQAAPASEKPELEQPPETSEQPMEIHKPKPIHNLREFLKEYGIIVLGVLTALGLEQAIESYHANERSETARKAMDAELRFSIAKATVITEMADCSERQLAAIAKAIGQNNQPEVRRLVAASRFPHPYTWSDAAWQTALASGVSDRFSGEQRRAYSILYGVVDELNAKQEPYVSSYARLRAIALTGLSPSSAASGAELSEMAQMTAALGALQEVAQTYQDASKNLLRMRVDANDIKILPGSDQPAKCQAAAAALGTAP